MPPRVRHHVTEERQRDLGETNEHRIIVAEAREESAIKKEGRHAVGAALDDIRQAEQQAASGGNRYSPSLGLSFQF